MTQHDFIFWLKGFMDGTNKYQPTPKQWEQIREKLDIVEMEEGGYKEITDKTLLVENGDLQQWQIDILERGDIDNPGKTDNSEWKKIV